MSDDDSRKQSNDSDVRANERATVADTPDSDPRIDGGGDEGSSGNDTVED